MKFIEPTALLVAAVLPVFAHAAKTVPPYGQCGGSSYSGSTQCDAGTVCVKLNNWCSQCQPGQGSTQVPTTTISTSTVSQGPTTTTSTVTSTATAPTTSIPAGALTKLTANFGTNPTNVGIYVYKPANVKNNPPLLLAMHGCGGSAQQFYSATQFKQLADQRGFLIIYGSAANDMNCWDNVGQNSLKHNGGSDSLALANAIRYAISEWGVDANRVFSTGMSSGAMMTNTMAAVYPDLIKAGASFAGVAMGCLKGNMPSFPADPCAGGSIKHTPQEWAEIVRRAWPQYTGSYPRMQIWHDTADPAVNITNLDEQVKQWTQMHNISDSNWQRQRHPKIQLVKEGLRK